MLDLKAASLEAKPFECIGNCTSLIACSCFFFVFRHMLHIINCKREKMGIHLELRLNVNSYNLPMERIIACLH